MRITPLDVRKQEFRKAVRGLDADEVHAFLATVADEYEFVLTDNKKLRDKVIELDEKVGEYRNMERTLRDTLLTAERVMAEARQNARKEADLILRDAQMKASQEVAGINGRVEGLRQQIRDLRGHRDSYLTRLHSLSEAQISLVDSYRQDFESTDKRIDGAGTPAPADPVPAATDQPAQTPSIPAWDAAPVADMVPVTEAVTQIPDSSDQWRSYDMRDEQQPAERQQPIAQQEPAPAPPHMHTPEPDRGAAFDYQGSVWEAPAIQDYPVEEESNYAERLSEADYDARVASVADAWSGAVPTVNSDSLPEGDVAAIDEVSAAIGMFSEDSEDLPAPAPLEGESALFAPVSAPAELAPGGLPTEAVDYAEGSPYPEADIDEASAPSGSGEQEESEGSRWSISRIARGITGG
ncbi:hypothetical protein DRQ32_08600 [bacterium]|nr:MAG: hypothetical protein DRQ32_08600 [bacterium]